MTQVNFLFALPHVDRYSIPQLGRITFTPTPSRQQNPATGYTRLPAPFSVEIPATGTLGVTLEPNDPTWAWRLNISLYGADAWEEYVTIPDQPNAIDHDDLTRIDPSTLTRESKADDAWWAMAGSTVDSGTVESGRLKLHRRNGSTIDAGQVQGDKGDKGDKGDMGTIGTVTANQLPAGELPTIVVGGTTSVRTLHFGIPKGDTGAAGTIASATATALEPAEQATVTLGGTPQVRTLAFGIPRGEKGDTGSIDNAPLATPTTPGYMSAPDKVTFDDATPASTASTIVKRDPNGNYSAAAPLAETHVTTKSYVDQGVNTAVAPITPLTARVTTLETDTGWIDVTPASGITWQGLFPLQVRNRNGVTALRGGPASSGMVANASNIVATLPAKYRPIGQPVYSKATHGDWDSLATLIIGTDGTVTIRTGPTLKGYYLINETWMQ